MSLLHLQKNLLTCFFPGKSPSLFHCQWNYPFCIIGLELIQIHVAVLYAPHHKPSLCVLKYLLVELCPLIYILLSDIRLDLIMYLVHNTFNNFLYHLLPSTFGNFKAWLPSSSTFGNFKTSLPPSFFLIFSVLPCVIIIYYHDFKKKTV